jgi:hypothetical protein
MKYNVGDVILTISTQGMPKKYRNKIGVIVERSDMGRGRQPAYRIMICGMDKEIYNSTTWMTEDSVKEVLYYKNPPPP